MRFPFTAPRSGRPTPAAWNTRSHSLPLSSWIGLGFRPFHAVGPSRSGDRNRDPESGFVGMFGDFDQRAVADGAGTGVGKNEVGGWGAPWVIARPPAETTG